MKLAIAVAVGATFALAPACDGNPAAQYPTPGGYCALECPPLGCCPWGGSFDGYVCDSPEDRTGEVCYLPAPVSPGENGFQARKPSDAGTFMDKWPSKPPPPAF